jgi:hypothetical protein
MLSQSCVHCIITSSGPLLLYLFQHACRPGLTDFFAPGASGIDRTSCICGPGGAGWRRQRALAVVVVRGKIESG